jgi:uncharacterized protein
MEHTGMKVLIHASAFFAPFLVPILMFLISEDNEIKKLSIQAVLFQLVIGVLITVSAIMSVFLIGIPFVIGFFVMWIVVPIIGIVKALKNEAYEYPIVGKWVQ